MLQVNPKIIEVGRGGINTDDLIKVLETGTCVSFFEDAFWKVLFES